MTAAFRVLPCYTDTQCKQAAAAELKEGRATALLNTVILDPFQKSNAKPGQIPEPHKTRQHLHNL